MKTITEKYKGVNFFAYSEDEMQKIKDNFDFERSIFYRSGVYNYSCIARELDDNTIELIEYFNNGNNKKITIFDNRDIFWRSQSTY